MDPGLASFMASGSRIVLYIILILMCFGVLGIETASFLALFTSGGVAIGLAFQGAVTNLAGGVMILLFHPFRVGDYIETTEIAGTVNAISVLYTVVLTPDNKRVTVPNGSLTNAAITNYSAVGQRRVELTFSVSYDCDIDKVKQILLSVAESDPKSLKDPAPLARMKTQSASSLDFVLRVWCAPENYWDLYFDLNENVKKRWMKPAWRFRSRRWTCTCGKARTKIRIFPQQRRETSVFGAEIFVDFSRTPERRFVRSSFGGSGSYSHTFKILCTADGETVYSCRFDD